MRSSARGLFPALFAYRISYVMRTACIQTILCAGALLCACDAIHRPAGHTGNKVVVEAAVFEGGYGIQWHQKIAQRYNEAHASDGVRVDLWGDPRAQDKIKPRILRRDPPDLLLMRQLPFWRLVAAGKVCPLDESLDQTGYGTDRSWRDCFIPGTLQNYTSGGKVYAVPSVLGAWACWYDARLFREHGWTIPATWGEFDQLCETIQRAGIAPLAFQGKYPRYAWFTFTALVQRCGGVAAINRDNQMQPGAFSHPDVLRAASMLQSLAQRHFQPGALAMTHTEGQLQFVNHHAAMIFCGLWLVNEMKESTPPDFEMRCFNVPAVENGKGNPHLFNGMGTEYVFVPSDARHPKEAADFARYLVSPLNAPDMCGSIGVISPLREGTPREALSPPLQSALDMVGQASGFFNDRLNDLLLEWDNQVMQPNMAALLRGEITPEAFGAALDAGLAAARENPDLVVPEYYPLDPAAYGEPS